MRTNPILRTGKTPRLLDNLKKKIKISQDLFHIIILYTLNISHVNEVYQYPNICILVVVYNVMYR